MTLPAWLVSRPAVYAAILIATLGAVGLWFHAHDMRIKREAVTAELVKQKEAQIADQDSVNALLQDSLDGARENTDTATVHTQAAVNSYQRNRAAINTTSSQPSGVAAGSIVVPIAFVHAADSLARLVPQLMNTMAQERAASELRIEGLKTIVALQDSAIVQLKIAVSAARPGLSGRIKDAAIGGAIVAIGLQLLRK